MRGWPGQIAARLQRLLREYESREILPYDDAAAAAFARLQRNRIRIGTMDMRIGAIALTYDALLISRNLRDFKRIPNLRVEDWTN